MKRFDLLDYTDHTAKIDKEVLSSEDIIEKSSTMDSFFSHLFDLGAVVTSVSTIDLILKVSFSKFMISSSLQKSFLNDSSSFMSYTFAIVMMSYFFFSYFFNHGQTWGMHLFKRRIPMKDKDFKSALTWTLYSCLVCMTVGLTALIWKSKSLRTHDYLYHDLMKTKTDQTISLRDSLVETVVEENYEDAA